MSAHPPLVIFDFDGVLASSEDVHLEAFRAVLHEEGLELTREAYYRDYLGLPDAACLAAAVTARRGKPSADALADLVRRKRSAFAERLGSVQLYPGVPELLRTLHARHALAVASGAFRAEIEAVLDRAGVRPLFRAIVAAEDVRRGKPAPDPFLRALACVNDGLEAPLGPGDCLVVEDAPHGIEAARAAGMRCVAVTTSHTRTQLARADAVLDDVTALAHSGELSR